VWLLIIAFLSVLFCNIEYDARENFMNFKKRTVGQQSRERVKIGSGSKKIIAVVHLAGDLSDISTPLHRGKKYTYMYTHVYVHTLTQISRRPSAATRNFVHERPEDWLVVNPISACGFEVVFPTRTSSSYHRCSRCQGFLGSSFFTLNNFPFGWTIRVHPTTVLSTI